MSGASVTCESVRTRVSAYVDQELPAAGLAEVRAHLGGCPGCRGAAEAVARVDAVARAALADHPFGDAGVEAVLTAVRARRGARRASGRAGAITLFAAAAALLLGVGLALAVDVGGSRPPGRQPLQPIVARAGAGVMILDGRTGQRSTGNVVRTGDVLVALQTPGGVFLDDGTRLELHADTAISLRPGRDGALAAVFQEGHEGKLLCETPARGRPLRVVTRELEAEVLGTRFVVEQVLTGSQVTVIEGRVRVAGPAQRRAVDAGRVAFVSADDGRVRVTAVVAPRRAALWVPRIAEEYRLLQPPPAEPSPWPAAPRPPRPEPPAPRPPAAPHMDVPVGPPTVEGMQED